MSERDGLIAFLAQQREAVRNACFGLTDEQARATPLPSSLSLGGLVKHLIGVERTWRARIEGLEDTAGERDQSATMAEYMESFHLTPYETLAGTLDDYATAAAETDRVVLAADYLNRPVQLPDAPWLPNRNDCTVRWVVLHLLEETARHAGHADLLREAVDGALSGPLMAASEGWPEDGWIKPWRVPPLLPDAPAG
jgi:uncharacterized damage-inducible protein DinB